MAISTERTVRDRIVKEQKTLAKTLGFDLVNGNFHDYLLDFHRREERASYLMAPCDGNKKTLRAWGAQVTSDENWYSLGNIGIRTYVISVRAYYAMGVGGEGVNKLTDHLRIVRGAIFDLGTNLDGTVDNTKDVSTSSIEVLESGIGLEQMLQATIIYTAEKRNPDF